MKKKRKIQTTNDNKVIKKQLQKNQKPNIPQKKERINNMKKKNAGKKRKRKEKSNDLICIVFVKVIVQNFVRFWKFWTQK